jgi:TonB family protein
MAPQPPSYAAPQPLTPIPSASAQQLPRAQFSNVQQLDAAIDALRRASWELHSMFGPLQDVRGRTAGEDVDEWLLTPEHLAELQSLRASAAASKSPSTTVIRVLAPATQLVEQETYMASVVGTYWTLVSLAAQHNANLQIIGARLAPPLQPKSGMAGLVAQQAAQKDFPEAMAAQTPENQRAQLQRLNVDHAQVLRELNDTRTRYAEQLSKQLHDEGQEPVVYSRETPCPEPVTQTSGKDLAAFASGNSPPDSFYPDSSRRAEYEGRVTVKAWISAAGCMQKATVYATSGVAELDEAAIRWTQQAEFLPAERDQKAVDGSMTFRVEFKLR